MNTPQPLTREQAEKIQAAMACVTPEQLQAWTESIVARLCPVPVPPYDYDGASEQLNVKRSWLEEQVQKGRVPYHRFGRHVRFTAEDLEQIIADRARAAIPTRRW